jgi:transcriptional regulator with XRE-family HTH domain
MEWNYMESFMAKSEHGKRASKIAAYFGPRLKELRASRGLSQAALAKLVGVSQSRIAEFESPTTKYRPTWETVLQFSFALGIDPGFFVMPPSGQK